MPIIVPRPQPDPPPAWWGLLTPAMQKELLGWLRVRKVDTAGWPKP